MSILFAGTPENAALTLRDLVKSGAPIGMVLTRPDAPIGRKSIMTPSPVAVVAEELSIPCIKTAHIGSEVLAELEHHKIEFAIVVAYGVLLKPDALESLPKGWFNLHYSLLPKWRGAAPVQRALMAGDLETGVSLFKIDEGLDTGPILATAPTHITPNENAGELLARLTHLGVSLLLECLPKIQSGLMVLTEQDGEKATFAPKLTRRDSRLSFELTSNSVESILRGVNPEPGAWFDTTAGQLKVIAAQASSNSVPRESIQLINGEVYVGASKGSLKLFEVQPAGKKPMKAADWFRGLRVAEVKVQDD